MCPEQELHFEQEFSSCSGCDKTILENLTVPTGFGPISGPGTADKQNTPHILFKWFGTDLDEVARQCVSQYQVVNEVTLFLL